MAEETSGGIGPWWLVAFSGLSSLVLGFMLLVWPGRTLLVITVVVGIQLLFFGIARLGGALFGSGRSQRGMLLLSGLGGILVGLVALFRPNRTIEFLVIFLGLYWVLSGLADIVSGLVDRDHPGRVSAVLFGILSAVAGLVALFWSGPTELVLAIVAGVNLAAGGLTQIVMGFRLRKSKGSAAVAPSATT